MRGSWAAVAAIVVAGLTAACGSSTTPGVTPDGGDSPGGNSGKYDALVTRTKFGIPHIKADDYGSLGYGLGYAFAEDNLCVMQEDLVTIRGERAKHFGRDGSYTIVPNGVTASNVNSDFFWRMAASEARVAPTRDNTMPEFKRVTEGYVDGYNRYMRELKAGQHPGRHAACRDASWLYEINTDDMYRRYLRLALIASSSALLNEIATAAPMLDLSPEQEPSAEQKTAALQQDPGALRYFTEMRGKRFGSNMYALGKDATQDGSSMVFGNPHFPWTGTERLYLSHLDLAGRLEMMGASLYGIPAILIGFNDHVAWSHTVSTAYRFTLYELTLNPLNPMQYRYGLGFRDIEQIPITIDVKEADGSMTQESRTLYRSHYGPMLVIKAAGLPILGWSPVKAYTMRDANAENDRLINQFASWNTATSLEQFIQMHGDILGVPWVNTVASGPGGKAYYGDVTVVPNVPDTKVQTCQALPIHQVVNLLMPGLPVLNGSRPACEWDSDVDAPVPGVFGRSNLPKLQRDDWVANNNDSHWLTNPAAPLTGYAGIIGDEGSARSYRTQQAITQMQHRLDGSDGLGAPKFTIPLLQQVTLSSRIKTAEYGLANVLSEICPGTSGNEAAACAALARWDGTGNADAVGAHVWREFMRALTGGADRGGNFWRVPYSAADPVNTPRDLNTSALKVKNAFRDGVAAVKASGYAFDATLGEIQHPCCILRDIPIFGGDFFEGAFTIASSDALTPTGYDVAYGNSYIQTVTWNDEGVQAEGFITYSQSTDPANPHFSDYTKAYAAKQWHKLPFRDAEIEAEIFDRYRLTE